MAKKYWEVEEPKVISTEKNEIRVFKEHGKIQVYPKISSAARGIGRGATIDLEVMTKEELEELRKLLNSAIDSYYELV